MHKNRLLLFSFLLLLVMLTFSNCAKRGFISGGPKDTIPPVVLGSYPDNYSTNFDSDQIKIAFDELVKINKLNQNLIISPPMDRMPDVTPMGNAKREVTIKILDTLKPNTTYSFNFGDAIVDNNENNPLQQFKYVFSTGDYVDSLKLSGTIKTANQLKSDNFVNVMLYDAKTFTDSTVYKEKPLYVTNTLDSLTTFTIENIKEGTYYLIALKDKSNDYMFNPKADKIAFIKDSINIPTDKTFELALFNSQEEFQPSRPVQESQNKWYLPYFGDNENVEIKISKNDSIIQNTYTLLPQKDSLQVWFPTIKADSLHFEISKGNNKSIFTVKPKGNLKAIDSLSVSGQTGVLHYINDYKITTTTPVKAINKELITIINKDSVKVEFDIKENLLEQTIYLKFDKAEEDTYQVNLLPGAITDFFNHKNDTLNYRVNTTSHRDYGNLTLQLNGVKSFPIIVELLNEQEQVIATQYSEKDTELTFDLLPPRKYWVRVTYDTNKNGKWDTGYYWDRRQPEETIYSKELIDLRANWDWVQQINLTD